MLRHARAYALMVAGAIGFGSGAAGVADAAPPSWDRTLSCDSTSNCPRFTVLANMQGRAVLDNETGLVWEQEPQSSMVSWYEATQWCHQSKVGGRMGWRLPSVEELASLVEPTLYNPGLPPGHPFVMQWPPAQTGHWTASSPASSSNVAYTVNFYSTLRVGVAEKAQSSVTRYAWCVRGGQGVPPR